MTSHAEICPNGPMARFLGDLGNEATMRKGGGGEKRRRRTGSLPAEFLFKKS